jgi:uncharacterized protein YdeI (YjbR/CyaY-like superfamily)
MDVTETFYAADRAAWREWLSENHATAKEIWLLYYTEESGKSSVAYIHAVEEALCFGWIDGIAKKIAPDCRAQRFTPRRPKGNWTELNKERVRRLIASGLMTEAGLRVAPDLSLDSFQIAEDILAAIQADAQAWAYFQQFEPLYVRIRISYIESARKQPAEFQKRLERFIEKTRQNKQFGGME